MGTLSQSLREYVAGCFTGIWIESREPQEAITEIAQLCREESWHLAYLEHRPRAAGRQ